MPPGPRPAGWEFRGRRPCGAGASAGAPPVTVRFSRGRTWRWWAAEALTLSRLCRRVYLVHRRDALRAERRLTEELERTENVTFLWNAQAEAVLGTEVVTGLAYRELPASRQRELPCAGVFIAAGREPSTELVRGQLELDAGGYIPADETTRTAIPGVFAAGDVRAKAVRQVVTAVADGAVAALMAAKFLEA